MATRKSFAVIERALLQLPERCRYHGDGIDRGGESWVHRPCCDTGFPSLLRREALRDLEALTAQDALLVEAQRLRAELATARAQVDAVLALPDIGPEALELMDPEQYHQAIGYNDGLAASTHAITGLAARGAAADAPHPN